MKIKAGDTVFVTTGKDKGKKGKVIRAIPDSAKVVIEKINMRVKHIKKTKVRPGERITFEAPLPVSNVALFCQNCKKPVRLGYQFMERDKIRICKKCKKSVDSAIPIRKTATKK